MVFGKPLMIVGSLIGASSIGIGGYLGFKSLMADKTIFDKLAREGEFLLNTNPDINADEADWKSKITAYSASGLDTNLKIEGLDITSSSTDNQVTNIRNFKKKCSDLLNTSLDIENLSSIISKARKWCVKEKQSS